ncbi:hypothetical protein ONS96_010064 [Cadophora gregata f. sp. sojae]|nr:hypothetical protein ONS96_010064 [Cadophora gregata f. sp. sojae]
MADTSQPNFGSSSSATPASSPGTPPVARPSYQEFAQKGQELHNLLLVATGPDKDYGYTTKHDSYFTSDEPADPFLGDHLKVGKNLKVPFMAMGLRNNNEWMLRQIIGKDVDLDHPGNVVYHSKEQQSMVITDIFNDGLGAQFEGENKIFHSEFAFHGWKHFSGDNVGDLRYVVIAQIQNDAARQTIKDARATIKNTPMSGPQITFRAAAQDNAESQGFFALAGTKVGKLVFRMLTDHHTEMKERRIAAVHTWDSYVESLDPVLIWELE